MNQVAGFPMSLLGELHRRHVLRVVAAYAVVAWLLIQIADVIFPRFGLPEWTVTFVIILFALGFPLAVTLSWSFDITPTGLHRDVADLQSPGQGLSLGRKIDFFIIATLVILLGIMWYRQNLLVVTDHLQTVADHKPDSILVLPFRNLSQDSDNRYFAEGISEEIMSALVKLPQLRVSGRVTADALRARAVDAQVMADELDLDYILDGSVRKQEHTVLIAVQLTDARSGYSLWTETYEQQLEDIFKVQKHISQAVIGALQLELLPEEIGHLGEVTTTNAKAYDLYLQGLEALRDAVSSDQYDNALGYFDQALRIDPTFVESEAGKCRALQEQYDETQNADLIQQAIGVCNRAATMNARSPQVQLALGNLYLATGRPEYALEAFNLAIELAPTLDSVWRARGDVLTDLGRMDEAKNDIERAIELAPGEPQNHASYAYTLYANNQLDAAIAQYRKAAELDPQNPRHFTYLSAVLFKQGRFEEAAEAARASLRIAPSASGYSNAGTNYFYSGQYERAMEMFQEAVKLAPNDARLCGNLADACQMSSECSNPAEYYELALRLTTERLSVNPQDAVALASQGLYHAQLGQHEAAVSSLQRALAQSPDNNDVLYAAAAAWARMNDRSLSSKYAQQALQAGYPVEALRADPFINYAGKQK